MVQIRQIGPKIGVEVSGVDIKQLDDQTFAAIYQAWIGHNVLVVTGQDLTIPDFLTYSRRFGHVTPHPSKSTRHPEFPEITVMGVNKFTPDGKLNDAIYRRGAEGWHTDGAYDPEPFKATQLYGIAIPDRGGDTLFASGYAAYETLDPALKARLEGKRARHFYHYGSTQKGDGKGTEAHAESVHPIFRTHDKTGRKAVYVNRLMTVGIEGMSDEESGPLLEALFDHSEKAEFVYRHQWRVGDLLLWDNRCSTHARDDFPADQRRLMLRTTVAGSVIPV